MCWAVQRARRKLLPRCERSAGWYCLHRWRILRGECRGADALHMRSGQLLRGWQWRAGRCAMPGWLVLYRRDRAAATVLHVTRHKLPRRQQRFRRDGLRSRKFLCGRWRGGSGVCRCGLLVSRWVKLADGGELPRGVLWHYGRGFELHQRKLCRRVRCRSGQLLCSCRDSGGRCAVSGG